MRPANIHSDENAYTLRNADRLWHLQKTGLTEGRALRDVHSMTLATSCRDLLLKKNQVIYHQGDEADSLYIFNRGAVRLEVTTPNRRRKIVRIFANGHVFGEEAYIREGSHQTAAVAQIVGANRPHVSAIMFDLEKRGLVRCQGTKLLVNEQELAKQIDTEALP